jgi:hypothetical protein
MWERLVVILVRRVFLADFKEGVVVDILGEWWRGIFIVGDGESEGMGRRASLGNILLDHDVVLLYMYTSQTCYIEIVALLFVSDMSGDHAGLRGRCRKFVAQVTTAQCQTPNANAAASDKGDDQQFNPDHLALSLHFNPQYHTIQRDRTQEDIPA